MQTHFMTKSRFIAIASILVAFAFAFALAGCSSGGGDGEANKDVTGIIGAMEDEVGDIKEAMSDVQVTTISGMEFTEGTIDGNKAIVVQCGMGKVNAGICAQTLINNFGVTRVINTGVAGSLSDELGLNDFVISTDAVQHDFDVSPIGFKKGEIPYTGLIAFTADETMRKQAVEAVKQVSPDSKVLEGRVCTGDQFINTDEQVKKITGEYGGLCAEMEGGAIAQVCHLNETPFVIIRAISDDSDHAAYEKFNAEISRECADVTLTMVKGF